MPFSLKQKAPRDPTYRQEQAVEAIQERAIDLENAMRKASRSAPMQSNINQLRKLVHNATQVVWTAEEK